MIELIKIIGLFCLLGMGFFVIQLIREYYWIKRMGGIDALYCNLDDVIPASSTDGWSD